MHLSKILKDQNLGADPGKKCTAPSFKRNVGEVVIWKKLTYAAGCRPDRWMDAGQISDKLHLTTVSRAKKFLCTEGLQKNENQSAK